MGNRAMKSSKPSASRAAENIPEGNGILFLGKPIPQEALYNIFLFVPTKDLCKSVTRVCKLWNDLLTDKHFWFTKLQIEGVTFPSSLRSRLLNDRDVKRVLNILKIISSGHLPLNQNIIKNPSGREKFQNWTVDHGGDGLIIEENPIGTDPIPEQAGHPTQHCFVTSYHRCRRQQVINLRSLGYTPWMLNVLKPKIEISEWVSARFDCRSKSQIKVILVGERNEQTVVLDWSSDDDGVLLSKWYKINKVVTDYPEGLHQIRYINIGQDSQYWAGYYGAKSAGSSVKLVLA